MASTILLAALLIVMLVGSLLLTAVFLRWGARWAKIPGITFRRALVGSIALSLMSLVWQGAILWAEATMPGHDLALGIAVLAASVLVNVGMIAWLFKARYLRAMQAWLLTLVPSFAIVVFAEGVFKPLVTEAFVIPTNAMAPTLVGIHWTGKCPQCGSTAFGSPQDPNDPRGEPPDGVTMICSRELRECKVQNPDRTRRSGDHVLVNKLLQPRRWDLVVFRAPDHPTTYYVKRMVGLPGEVVTIRDGAVCINGQKIEPPNELRGLEYVTKIEGFPGDHVMWGDEEHPAKLGPDEYFVLGDFSTRSLDSRLWEQGAPGHPPYAVPADHLIGVVTHIYWPPSRWRILR